MTLLTDYRLHNQQLSQHAFRTPGEVVAWLGAVQAQEYAHARWGLGLRLPGATDAEIEQAFTEGSILRTHVMRPTWHFVAPADIRWLLALTGPRVNAVNGTMYRRLELDEALFRRSSAALEKALQGGRQLTRAELAAVLEQAGIPAQGMRLGYIVHRAELDALVCSGARRGNQFTYALLEERAPPARTYSRDEALVELVRRFFTSHGPATLKDFAWWSGLTIADARAGLQMAGPGFVAEQFAGRAFWRADSAIPVRDPSPTAYLLPPYDEYTIAYKDDAGVLDPQHLEQAKNNLYGGAMVIDGRMIGYWRRTLSRQAVAVEIAPFRPLTTAEHEAFIAAAGRYGEFLGLPVELT